MADENANRGRGWFRSLRSSRSEGNLGNRARAQGSSDAPAVPPLPPIAVYRHSPSGTPGVGERPIHPARQTNTPFPSGGYRLRREQSTEQLPRANTGFYQQPGPSWEAGPSRSPGPHQPAQRRQGVTQLSPPPPVSNLPRRENYQPLRPSPLGTTSPIQGITAPPRLRDRQIHQQYRGVRPVTRASSDDMRSQSGNQPSSYTAHPTGTISRPRTAHESAGDDTNQPGPSRQPRAVPVQSQSGDRPPSGPFLGPEAVPRHNPNNPTILPRSTTGYINPLRMNPPNVVGSSTMPLRAAPETTESAAPETARTRPIDPDEINRKVQQMLAETAKLKGDQPSQAGIPTSSTAASKSSMFAKPKGIFKKISSAIEKKFQGKDGHPSHPGHLSLREQVNPPLETMERLVNEAENLDRHKVKKMTGGDFKIKRKPVPGQGGSGARGPKGKMPADPTVAWEEEDEDELDEEEREEKPRGRKRSEEEDPFTGPSSSNHPAGREFERRLRAASSAAGEGMAHLDQRHPDDPFVTERILQSDPDAPLGFPPEGASTPRRAGGAPRSRNARDSSESPTRGRPRRGPTEEGGSGGWM